MNMNSFDSPIYAAVSSKPERPVKDHNQIWKIIAFVALIISIVSVALSIGLYFNPRQQFPREIKVKGQQEANSGSSDKTPSTVSTTTLRDEVEVDFTITRTPTTTLTTTTTTTTTQTAGSCSGVVFKNECYFLPIKNAILVSHSSASQVCAVLGNNTLAEITSDFMYHVISRHMRTKWFTENPNDEKIELWLGSTFQATDNTMNEITLRNGSRIEITTWAPGFPVSNQTFINTGIMIAKNIGSSSQGFFNSLPDSKRAVPLCSRDI